MFIMAEAGPSRARPGGAGVPLPEIEGTLVL